MRSVVALSAAACAALAARPAGAFTCPPASSIAAVRPAALTAPSGTSILHARQRDDVELMPSLTLLKDTPTESSSMRRRLRNAGTKVLKRMDTMKAAGFHEEDGLAPLQSGFKMNVGLLVGAFLFKWYRARFITKIPVWDRQPQWNMVVTSPEQEKELHAYSCKQCGATIFIARHREWFFKGGNTECTNCGAKGKDNFVDIRGEVIDSIDDDYFDYESPLDFVSAAERRKLVKQAGGDEELAKKLAIENAMKNDAEQIQVEEESSGDEAESVSESAKPEKKSKKKKKKKKKSTPKKKEEPEDIFDELDMDL